MFLNRWQGLSPKDYGIYSNVNAKIKKYFKMQTELRKK